MLRVDILFSVARRSASIFSSLSYLPNAPSQDVQIAMRLESYRRGASGHTGIPDAPRRYSLQCGTTLRVDILFLKLPSECTQPGRANSDATRELPTRSVWPHWHSRCSASIFSSLSHLPNAPCQDVQIAMRPESYRRGASGHTGALKSVLWGAPSNRLRED